MLKRLLWLALLCLTACALPAAARPKITLLAVPADPLAVQIAQDISRRYPVLLVTYQTFQGRTRLHAWNGDNWVPVSADDYARGAFFANRPSHALVIDSEQRPAPAEILPVSIWCAGADRIHSADPRVLIHLLGRHFQFPFVYWEQFSKRYNYTIEQINPELIGVSAWHDPGELKLDKTSRQQAVAADLRLQSPLTTLPPPPVELPPPTPPSKPQPRPTPPVKAPAEKSAPLPAVKPAPASQPAVASPAPATLPAIQADPFSAEEIPAAEVVVPPAMKKPWWKI
jgi:hypothetical protein